jgi:hypothetical protein
LHSNVQQINCLRQQKLSKKQYRKIPMERQELAVRLHGPINKIIQTKKEQADNELKS